MAKLIETEVNPTLIPNTTMVKVLNDGVPLYFKVSPNEGYVLHDNTHDVVDIDPNTMVQSKKLGYTEGYVTCGANYAFTERNIEVDGETLTAYGDREFVAVLKTN